jgi:hypothetical protein
MNVEGLGKKVEFQIFSPGNKTQENARIYQLIWD